MRRRRFFIGRAVSEGDTLQSEGGVRRSGTLTFSGAPILWSR
nr:MAG TPA: hypothetical protein [Caudoviricetes sp.]